MDASHLFDCLERKVEPAVHAARPRRLASLRYHVEESGLRATPICRLGSARSSRPARLLGHPGRGTRL